MRQGWESEAENWASFARTPGYDSCYDTVNAPTLLGLLPPPGRRTLDLACGEGRLSRLLLSLGYRVVGIDAAPTMVRLAAAHEAGTPALLADGTTLPFGDETFDLVVAHMCLHDFDEMPQAVAEIGRVLEPSGRLCLAIPHPINTAGAFQSRDPDAAFVISGSYLDPTPTRDQVSRGDVQLTFHSEHRPLGAYTEALEAAGLLIETLREVPTTAAAVERDPADRRWQRIPLFLHLRAIKPAPGSPAASRGEPGAG
jgi:SAM-dependent methyltransferase